MSELNADEGGWTMEELETLGDGTRPQDRQDLGHPATREEPSAPDEETFQIIERETLRDLGRRARAYARHPSSSAKEAVAYLDLSAAIEGVLELDRVP